MKKIFTLLCTVLFATGIYAATEQAWYSDVTSITNNGQYYIYSVGSKGFMQGGNSKLKAVTTSNYNTESNLLFTISTSSNRTFSGSNYLCSYETKTCGPVGGTNSDGSTMIWENKSSYWLTYGSYTFIWSQKAYLYYSSSYSATCLNPDLSDTKFHWYLISPAQYNRHFAIYFFDAYKETLNISQYNGLVPAAYYTALETAYNQTFSVKNAEHSAEVVNAAKANLEALYNGAPAVAEAYANAKDAINALEAVEDKGEDFAEVTSDIANARTAIEEATTVDAINAIVAALKAIDPITFNVTEFTALEALGTPASTAAGRTITYEAADKTVINAAGMPIHKGTTTLTATAAATDTYYKFVRTAEVTVIALPTSAQETKTVTYGAQESWNGYDLSTYTVGSHELVYVTENAQGGIHTITLTLTVNKLETMNVPVELSFCAGGSETYRGVEYSEAGTFNVPAEGATRDTIYNVTVTILQPTFGTDSKTIVYGAQESWNGIDLSEYTVGTHQVPFVTTNAAGCDSTVTLNLTVNKMATLEVPETLEFCVGGSETYRGVEYTEAGTFNVPAEGATRDTVYVVTVNVLQPTTGTDTKTIVVGAEESWNGIALQDSTVGVHYVVYETTNVAGCDSTVTLTLTVTKANVVEVPVELVFCQGDSVEYRGAWYTAAGLYPVYAEGEVADTVYNVNVTVNVPTFEEDEYDIQYGEEAEWNGIDLSGYTVGTHTIPFVTKNVAGCDSTITLTLTVEKMDEFEAEQELEFCEGDSVQYRGVWYAEAGEYPVYAEGEVRDTAINVIVTVHEKAYAELERTVLAGNALTLPEGEWYLYDMPVEGEYQTLRSDTMGLVLYQYDETEFGCESVVKLIVTVTPNYEAIENVFVGEKAEKFFREGQLYIRRGEDIYTVTGERVE